MYRTRYSAAYSGTATAPGLRLHWIAHGEARAARVALASDPGASDTAHTQE
jgi:hypothetical protein